MTSELRLGAIDVHAHVAPPSFLRALDEAEPPAAARAASVVAFHAALTDGHARLAGMDEAGVATALISVPPPAHEINGDDRAGLAARLDDELLALAEVHPDRFKVMLGLPLPDVDAALRQLERLGPDPLVVGVYLLAHHVEWTLDEPRFEPVYHAASEAGLPVLLHPAFEPAPPAFRDWALPTSLDAPFSTSVVAARLMLSGVLDRVPDLTLIVPHLGGTLPYLHQRVLDQSGAGDAEHDIAHYLRTRVLLDTCSFHRPALRCAIDTAGADRLVLGSDYPFRGPWSRAVDDIAGSDLSEARQRTILRDTAEAHFRLQVRRST